MKKKLLGTLIALSALHGTTKTIDLGSYMHNLGTKGKAGLVGAAVCVSLAAYAAHSQLKYLEAYRFWQDKDLAEGLAKIDNEIESATTYTDIIKQKRRLEFKLPDILNEKLQKWRVATVTGLIADLDKRATWTGWFKSWFVG